MAIFFDYAKYYNLLYQDKEYGKEFDFVIDVLKKHTVNMGSLLDVGCGSGKHLFAAAQQHIHGSGVDISENMLALAHAEQQSFMRQNPSLPAPQFHQGDARSFQLQQTFDNAISLFHVMSYQTSEDDMLSVLTRVNQHMRSGGYFLFDFWHGPGVLTDLPSVREKHLTNSFGSVWRRAVPTMKLADNTVDIDFEIAFTDHAKGEKNVFHETHHMRYWFLPELRFLCKKAGFTYCTAGAWMKQAMPTTKDWYAYMLVQKNT